MVVVIDFSTSLVPRPASMLVALRGTGRTPGVADQVIHGMTVIHLRCHYHVKYVPHVLRNISPRDG